MKKFSEFVKAKAVEEGLLMPDKAAASGVSKINPFPTTNAHRKKITPKPIKPVPPMQSFVSTVPQVVTDKVIPKNLKPFPRGSW